MSARKLLVGGNWKCNGSLKFVEEFSRDVLNKLKYNQSKVEVVVAPVALHVPAALQHI